MIPRIKGADRCRWTKAWEKIHLKLSSCSADRTSDIFFHFVLFVVADFFFSLPQIKLSLNWRSPGLPSFRRQLAPVAFLHAGVMWVFLFVQMIECCTSNFIVKCSNLKRNQVKLAAFLSVCSPKYKLSDLIILLSEHKCWWNQQMNLCSAAQPAAVYDHCYGPNNHWLLYLWLKLGVAAANPHRQDGETEEEVTARLGCLQLWWAWMLQEQLLFFLERLTLFQTTKSNCFDEIVHRIFDVVNRSL